MFCLQMLSGCYKLYQKFKVNNKIEELQYFKQTFCLQSQIVNMYINTM